MHQEENQEENQDKPVEIVVVHRKINLLIQNQ